MAKYQAKSCSLMIGFHGLQSIKIEVCMHQSASGHCKIYMQTLLDAVDGTLIFVAIELIAWWYLLFFLNENLIANTPIVSRRMMITPPRAPLTMKIIELLLSST